MFKKVLLGLAALSCVSLAAEGTNVYLKAGADMLQRFDEVKYDGEKLNKDDGDDFGYELTVEVMREVYPNFELGLGLSYQDHGDPKKNTNKNWQNEGYDMTSEIPGFKSVPLYVTAKYNFPVEGNIKPYLKADLGYSFNSDNGDIKIWDTEGDSFKYFTKVENGLYYGIGAGAEYNNFVVDLMYKVNRAEMKADVDGERIKKDLDYSRITLSVGYRFNF
ncbi:outer membrane beta-barrel protein [Fusobacterium varium]|uniref:outer membrane beta-barrel protein n=1 Tax=Fusobacterium varium TaxID=856 RepID=UPI00242DF35A|nr:outer membrane beta-barrel protein [Fusobacterium varium]MCF0171065.1 porin family protein [Fusobacterium varium]